MINNFHSLKNLKNENEQKSLKEYLLEDEYLKMVPLCKEKNNEIEKQQIKIVKDSKKKRIKKKKNIKNHINQINLNNYKIKNIIPLNSTQKPILRNFNSCFPKKLNQNVFINYTNDQILSTISNNHQNNNQKFEMLNSFKKNCVNITKNKCRNTSEKTHNEKSLNQKNEISYNILPEYCKQNILPFKKIKSLKNKIFISDFANAEYQNNNKNININNSKKGKPLATRIKLEMINEENKNKKFNIRNNINKSNTELINTPANNNNNNNNIFSTSKKIYYDNKNKNALKDINFKTLPYKCLSPNFHNAIHIIEKGHPLKIKQMYNKTNYGIKGRNSYSICLSSSKMENSNKNMGNNSLVIPNNNNNSNNIIFLKKVKKENLKDKYNNISNTVNYNIENISNFSTESKKIIVFNNVNNYNINNADNTLGNISNIKGDQSYQQCYLKPKEDLNNFSSPISKSYYRNPKKIYINKSSLSTKNNTFNRNISINKRQNSDILETNIFYADNSNNNNNAFLEIQKLNKYQYNKNMIYKLNKKSNNNLVNKIIYPQNINNYNNLNNGKNNNYSNLCNKERNSVNNKSHGNFNLIKENKSINNRIKKNNTIEIFEKGGNCTKKSISPIQDIKINF